MPHRGKLRIGRYFRWRRRCAEAETEEAEETKGIMGALPPTKKSSTCKTHGEKSDLQHTVPCNPPLNGFPLPRNECLMQLDPRGREGEWCIGGWHNLCWCTRAVAPPRLIWANEVRVLSNRRRDSRKKRKLPFLLFSRQKKGVVRR